MLKRIPISSNDFSLFDAELNSYEYEYFCKHIGAFKRFMQEEPKEQRQLFLDAFCEYSYNYIEIKAIATTSDPKKKFIESFRQYTQETFINGKFSAAKQFLNDSVLVARNKHLIKYMDSHSYAKDPFFHKETRDVFRRLFGEPTEAGTCVKVICVLPLYVRFAGSICRYLKQWLDMEESMYPVFVKGKKRKAEKKALKEQAVAAANAAKIAQQTKPTVSKQAVKLGAVGSSKSGSASGQQSTAAGSSCKTVANDDKSKAIVSLEESEPTQAGLDAAEDLSSFYYDLHERKQRKRDVRKKGKKHEHMACQHPCHGKVCNCNPHKHVHSHDHTHDHPNDHTHDHHHHHHNHDPPQVTREELMNCLCERHKALAEAKIAEKRAALQKQNMLSDEKQAGDKNPEGSKTTSDRNLEDQSSVKTSENGSLEDKSPGVESSGEKNTEEKGRTNEEGTHSENKSSEDKTSEDGNTINEEHSESKPTGGDSLEEKSSEAKNPSPKRSEDKNPSSKSSEKDKNVEAKDSKEDTNLEDKGPEEGEIPEAEGPEEGKNHAPFEGTMLEGNEKAEGNVVKEPEVKSLRGKKSFKRIRENGVVSSEDSSDCDEAVERFVRRTFPELHLQEPHPNQVYEQMIADEKAEKAEKEKLKKSKLRTCAFCRRQEMEVKSFKKCQKCKGKGTKFYCSRKCQKLDWTKHRLEH